MGNERAGLQRFTSAGAEIAATAPATATRGIAPDEGVQLRVPHEETPSPEVSIVVTFTFLLLLHALIPRMDATYGVPR